MAKIITDSYIAGKKEIVSQITGFVEAQQVFNAIKETADQFLAIQFYDEWCFYRYTGRFMEA